MPNTSNYSEQGGAKWVVGGELALEDGGVLTLESGAELAVEDGGVLTIEDGAELATESGGAVTIETGGALAVESGGYLDIESGGALKIAGTDKTALLAAAVASPVAGAASSYKLARGNESFTGTTAVTSGLTTVVSAVATLSQDISADCLFVSVSMPTQTGGDAGKFTI